MQAKKPSGASESESLIARWSRRKRQADRSPEERDPPSDPASGDDLEASAEVPREHGAPPPGDADMPPLQSLGPESDYSGFMSPGVSEELRRLALRKLFHSPLYNITDGLDDYDDDFTSFAVLREAFHAKHGKTSASEPGSSQGAEHETAGDPGRAQPARASSAELEHGADADSSTHPDGEAAEEEGKRVLPEPDTRVSGSHSEVPGASDLTGEVGSANGGPDSDDADAPAGALVSRAHHLSSAGPSGEHEEATATVDSSADTRVHEKVPAESPDERESAEDCDTLGHESDERLRHG